MRLAVAEMLVEDQLIVDGLTSLLIPMTIDHVLRVCLIAEMSYRIQQGRQIRSIDEKEALKIIRQADSDSAAWVDSLFSKQDPWDEALYDIVIPMNSVDKNRAGALIEENLLKD